MSPTNQGRSCAVSCVGNITEERICVPLYACRKCVEIDSSNNKKHGKCEPTGSLRTGSTNNTPN
jgi:hypothetical protein